MARLTSLTADTSTPNELSSEQRAKLSQHPKVIRLCQKNKALTTQIHAAGYRPISAAKGTRLFEKKKKIEARLNNFKTRLRTDMIEKARKQHFRTADTVTFNSQFSTVRAAQTSSEDAQRAKPVSYHLPERAVVVWLTCQPADGLSDRAKLTRRIRGIEARAALCRRQEARRHRRPHLSWNNRNPIPRPTRQIGFPWCASPPNAPSASVTSASYIWSGSLSAPHGTK